MDLNAVINRMLKRDKKTRNKRLYLRLFSAIPLSNNTGLVEWVPNTNVLRKLIDDEYLRMQKQPLQQSILTKFGKSNGVPQKSYGTAFDYAVKDYPPVFGKYFLHQFLEPNQWYQNRLNFVKTAAVWSMVGYIVGLGDRHSENILIDTNNGDTIHVDLAMLFESGRLLNIPEKVPFRLTRNMIDGMGVTGYEGAFRLTCEATLELLRKNNETLLNVLETFKHDPLLDWEQIQKKKENQAKKAMNSADVDSAHKIIGQKLQGIVGDSALPLSISGQVDYLIDEATNEENLKSMYIWWMPFL
ncbi:predicted protein [Naegleria gruberi]|uniref:Serine/threonine-protein kinase ATR n=1 Tax=Naegleria gruberi TaxID=5762 RepID=D2V760_NAEGR|nr:uncharacterized protein NAEGRDRAFT_31751 [Naegleria gruberi]EFC47314.1 predicted protein [Naegleria gruberi]|eukprot:XP_002680058.1 predicted protein [Naegleria gruberi strain NEG-M]